MRQKLSFPACKAFKILHTKQLMVLLQIYYVSFHRIRILVEMQKCPECYPKTLTQHPLPIYSTVTSGQHWPAYFKHVNKHTQWKHGGGVAHAPYTTYHIIISLIPQLR
jgi:hypothetical protein